jgi:hypothetical protein
MLTNEGDAIGVTRTAMPKASGLRYAAVPTSTAAMPTRLWNAATSCGIAVIWILRAVTRPIPPPTTIAPMISAMDAIGCVASVVTMAIVIPIMPVMLPRRLLSGFDRPRRARMKQTPAIR